MWMQRLKSAEMLEQVVREKEHPLIRETRRECMQELWDAAGVQELLYDIRSGAVKIREIYTDIPSPMSLPLQWSQEAAVMYDYAPTPRGIHGAVEEALKQEKHLIQPGSRELSEVQERSRLPQDEKQLHTLLMTEGDLTAGELEIPVEWLDKLAQEGRVLYLEQGLWIAAEQEAEYARALGEAEEQEKEQEQEKKLFVSEQLHIVRRMLRYRGGADAGQTADRYGWPVKLAEDILEELCRQKAAVKQDDRYYHGELYRRARVRTLKKRREEIQTSPGEHYAALMLSQMESGAPAAECVQNTIRQYAGMTLPAVYWEKILLPSRVRNYRPSLLDAFLSEGELFWHMDAKGSLRFDYQAAVDWETDRPQEALIKEGLTEEERVIYEAIIRRGACFMQALNDLLPAQSPYDTLLSLMEKGLVYADSFLPVRQWLDREKTKKAVVRQRVNLRVKALQTGRWDIVRPVRDKTIEEKLEDCFRVSPIISKETVSVCGLSWQEALSVLRIWEYTGQARRGYFVKDLSGSQFIRGKDYESVVRRLHNPEKKLVWVNAADPAQCWGKILPHREGRNFINVPGTAVACYGGIPVAVMERQGKVLRIWQEELKEECMRLFAEKFKQGSIFAGVKRIVVKEYPDTTGEALRQAGFRKEMQDYVLYL